MIGPEQIEHLKSRVDIATVIRGRVKLRKAGKNFLGLCPFHQENTASFNVNSERGSYYCFGCKAAGDVISFLERTEGLDFRGAIERLAELAGVDLEPEADAKDVAERRRLREATERMRRALELATQFYRDSLKERDGQPARDAIDRRNLRDPDVAVERFGLGYAPASWDALVQHLARANVSPADAEAVGLLIPKKHSPGYVDRFRHRLMFPVHDHHGRVVAFSSYALPRAEGMHEKLVGDGKYVNSPETPLYHKGRVLYGLWQAREAIAAVDEALTVEGNFDVVSLSVAGFTNVVAPLGSALTTEHVEILKRRVSRLYVGFDNDGAGHKAILHARPLLNDARLPAMVPVWPEKKDPDDTLREFGPEVVGECLRKAPPLTGWAIDHLAYGGRFADRKKTLEAAAEIIADENDQETEWLLCADVARRLGFMDTQVRAAVRVARKTRTKGKKAPSRAAPSAAQGSPPLAPAQRARVLPTATSEALRIRMRAVLRDGSMGMPESAPQGLQKAAEAARDQWEQEGAASVQQIADCVTDGRIRSWILKQVV